MSLTPVKKVRLATASLCGCFGCHMSLLDMDERLLDLLPQVEFDRTPLTDIKTVGEVDVALIEGGVANSENVEVLRTFRRQSRILVAVGACAINGGVPAMRNAISLHECLAESYLQGIGVVNAQIPADPEIPLLLNQVHPIHEVVKVDYSLPGCPPSAEMIWIFLTELLHGKAIEFPYRQIHYD